MEDTDFDITVSDSFGGENVLVFKGQAQIFQDLPKTFFIDGFHVKIEGDPGVGDDAYYIQWDNGEKAWKETLALGVKFALDSSTLPHQLISNADGSFTFMNVPYLDRVVGDDDSNPLPSFIGKKVADVFFHRNRLGFIADENVIFSRAGLFFDLFRPTVSQILDDDPIDLGVAHTKVSILSHAVPFNESLILFADQTQFTLDTGGDLLTSTTASITVATEYENDKLVRPVGAGRSVFFTTTRGLFSAVKEYIVENQTEILDAVNISSQVPRLIPRNLFKMAASTNESLLVALSRDAENEIYLYSWFWQGSEKFQSAWGKWVFPTGTKILNADFIQSNLYILAQYPEDNSVHLEVMNLEPSPVENVADSNYIFHLDRQVLSGDLNSFYNSRRDETIFTLPYGSAADMEVVVGFGGEESPGLVLESTSGSSQSTLITVPGGDFTDYHLVLGQKYAATYQLSPIFIRSGQPGAERAVVGGRTMIDTLYLSYARSGYFRVEVFPYGRVQVEGSQVGLSTYEFTGYLVSDPRYGVSDLPLADGTLIVSVGGRNNEALIKIVNDSFAPFNLLSLEWQGTYADIG